MKKKGPKLSRKAQSLLNKEDKPEKLVSAEDYWEQGAIDEESGDRWLSSDLSKALRFYQKGYSGYLAALEKPGLTDILKLEIYYNIARLTFHVYNQYYATDGIEIGDLTNVDEVLFSSLSVIKKLDEIVGLHESALDLSHQLGTSPLLDLLFNTAIVYVQVLEECKDVDGNFSHVYQLGDKVQGLFRQLLQIQVEQLQKFVKVLDENPDGEETADSYTSTNDEDESSTQDAVGEKVLQPPDVFDTVLSCYKAAQAMLENIGNPAEELLVLLDLINPFLYSCDTIANDLLSSFSESNNQKPDLISPITAPQIDEYKISKSYTESLTINEYDKLVDFWDSSIPNISEIPGKYLAISDSLQEFLDRNDINLQMCNQSNNPEMVNCFWNCLTLMTNKLKKAQELMSSERTELQKNGGEQLGTLLAQISNVMILRGDIDVQRCQMNHEQAIQNHDLLLKNAKVFLKNAMNFANSSGGLRERASEKIVRNKRKVEAVLRTCILENKILTQELDSIIGRQTWVRELPHICKLEYFSQFGINSITI